MESTFTKRTLCFGALMLTVWGMAPYAAQAAESSAYIVQQNDNKVRGNVSDSEGAIIGANVLVKGTTTGALTDVDGNFELKAKKGDILIVSYIGYKKVEVKVGEGPLNIVLEEDNNMLSEVVVTALGVKRERKALGYGLSEVKGEDLTKAKETNVVNSLSGKVAGLVVQNTAAGASGSTRVLLRGNTEMTGNNQPLYVVDGVPLDNTNFGSASEGGGYDLGDGISAINPDDIESMSVLKGPAASALYGSRASHGVILITTKKADKDKWSIEYNGALTVDTQLAKWDNVQREYGMGANGQYQLDAASGTNSSWGVKGDWLDKKYYDGEVRPFLIYPNNTASFFRTGLTTQNTAVVSVSSGKTGMRFSFTDMRNKDILPNTNMNRDNFNLRVNTSIGQVDFDFNASYTKEHVNNRPALGDSQSNVGKNLMTLASTYNQEWLKNYQNADGTYANWNGNDQYNKNPYWDLFKNTNVTDKDVFRLTGKIIWNINEHIKLQGTIGTDINNMDFSEFIARTTPGVMAGKYTGQIFRNRTLNAEILALYNQSFGDFDINATLGANTYRVNNRTTTNIGTDQQMDGIEAVMNYAEQSIQESTWKKTINSIYGSASVGYLHTYYLEGTLRGDQSSTLPIGNNVYIYPSVSGSWVFSEYIKNRAILSYGKLRASWAKVGSDTDPYLLALNYKTGIYSYGNGATIGMVNNDVKPNKDLKPTMTDSWEIGTELKFFRNRLSIDFTYYNQNSKNQILNLPCSSTSGYSRRLINAGHIQNTGFELAVNGRVLQLGDFAWDMGVNFSQNSNKVIELEGDMDYFELADAYWAGGGLSVGAEKGKNFGSIRGTDFKRNEKGEILIDRASGMPLFTETVQTIGDAAWDWTGGGYITLTYKDFRLSAGFDVKVGADIYSMSMRSAYLTGKAEETLEGREGWYRSEEQRKAAGKNAADWTPTGGYVAKGVYADNGQPNETFVNPEAYWKAVAEAAPSAFIYDNSYVKCRELTFGYNFPSKLLGNNKVVKALSVSFVARNPFIIWKNIPNIDPDSGYNTSGLGLEYGSLPSRRSFGINVNLKF